MSFFLADETPGTPYPHGNGVAFPYVVEAPNKPVQFMHGLGRVPRMAFVGRADRAVDLQVTEITRVHVVGTFDAGPAQVVLKIE